MRKIFMLDGYNPKIKIGVIQPTLLSYNNSIARIVIDVDDLSIEDSIISMFTRAEPIGYTDYDGDPPNRYIISNPVFLMVQQKSFSIIEFAFHHLCSGDVRYTFFVYDPFHIIKKQ